LRRRRRAAPAVTPDAASRVVSVLPAVAAIDRAFDYVVPPELDDTVRVGSVVRADLGDRRVAGWVVADLVEPPTGLALRPLTRVTGWGPPPDLVDLSTWAAWRWAGRRSALLASASPDGSVTHLPLPDRRPPVLPERPGPLAGLVDAACGAPIGILRLPPGDDTTVAVALVAQRGPTLVVVPSTRRAAVLAARLRRAGAGVAEVPHQWPQARAGAGIVVGARTAAWAPCPGLAAVVVLDAHDEGLVQEQAPTWWATVVAAERARRAAVPCVWITPCPTLDLLAAGTLVRPNVATERSGWASLEIVDRRHDDPRLGLYSDRLVAELRAAKRAVSVLNRTGRVRLLACGACGELARCERCGAAVAQPSSAAVPRPLVCSRCGTTRPPVCAVCDSARLRHRRVGVTRVREELETLVGRPVAEVTGATVPPPDGPLLVGTEAVLHRVAATDVVAFLDFDQELTAPRFRAGEEALALLARASRLVGGRRRGGRVLVQTRLPDHEVLRAAVRGDPAILSTSESEIREMLGLPPVRALAVISGAGAAELAAGVPETPGLEVLGPTQDRWTVRADSSVTLCDALAATLRPSGRVRVEVDPLRI
jgi:primosomal protein N' (replication factor Y)